MTLLVFHSCDTSCQNSSSSVPSFLMITHRIVNESNNNLYERICELWALVLAGFGAWTSAANWVASKKHDAQDCTTSPAPALQVALTKDPASVSRGAPIPLEKRIHCSSLPDLLTIRSSAGVGKSWSEREGTYLPNEFADYPPLYLLPSPFSSCHEKQWKQILYLLRRVGVSDTFELQEDKQQSATSHNACCRWNCWPLSCIATLVVAMPCSTGLQYLAPVMKLSIHIFWFFIQQFLLIRLRIIQINFLAWTSCHHLSSKSKS